MADAPKSEIAPERTARADARRNLTAILRAAREVFETSGVDAPVREIAERAGVGVGTLYRHFPQRSDLVKAIMQGEVDACVQAAADIAAECEPREALRRWMLRLVDLGAAKRGLAAALHSGDPAYQALPDYVLGRLVPALQALLGAAAVRSELDAGTILLAALRLAAPTREGEAAEPRKMVELLVMGLLAGSPLEP